MAPPPHLVVQEVLDLFLRRGDSQYGNEAVTQAQHALQAAALAEDSGADSQLIVAALLHDVGHLLHDLPPDSSRQGVDDCHERIGGAWLSHRFGPAVTEPVRLHVAAKRYLCQVDAEYSGLLSEPSRLSLALQGGPMTAAEVREFERHPCSRQAVQLRRWDDTAKDPGKPTPALESFRQHLTAAAEQGAVESDLTEDA